MQRAFHLGAFRGLKFAPVKAAAAFAIFVFFSVPSVAGLSPRELSQVSLSPVPGAQLPLGARFETAGGGMTLGEAIGGRPAVLMLASYSCRFICGSALAIAADGLSKTGLAPGKDFSFAVIGIDPKDGPADAAVMKAANLAPYPALDAASNFLSGSPSAIASVTAALNYSPVYDAEAGEYAHPVGVVILTGEGRVSRVTGGLNLQGDFLKAALLDARENKTTTLLDGIRLLCYGHDPLHGVYNSAIQIAIIVLGLTTLAGIAAMVAYLVRRKGFRP